MISNASDALEKLRYLTLSDSENAPAAGNKSLEIHIATDKQNRILTIQDTGVGMTRDELTSNLGTIARSGSKVYKISSKLFIFNDEKKKIHQLLVFIKSLSVFILL